MSCAPSNKRGGQIDSCTCAVGHGLKWTGAVASRDARAIERALELTGDLRNARFARFYKLAHSLTAALGRPRSLMRNLDGVTMLVSATAADGVVGGDTRLYFTQRDARVTARYAGGRVLRGWLVGRWDGDVLRFRYAQREDSGMIHAGNSVCVVEDCPDGCLRLFEHFTWNTRSGSGVNVFDELRPTN